MSASPTKDKDRWPTSPPPRTPSSPDRRSSPRRGRSGKANISDGCIPGGTAQCVSQARQGVVQLVRDAAGLPKRAPAEDPTSPRTPGSSSSKVPDAGRSPIEKVRDLFAAVFLREANQPGSQPTLTTGASQQQNPAEAPADGAAPEPLPGKPFQHNEAKLHAKWGAHDYDEDLQEDVFLERAFFPRAVNNDSFINFQAVENEEEYHKEWRSSPSKKLQKSFYEKHGAHDEEHREGTCRPCAYYLHKEDSCRWGDDCPFQHLQRKEVDQRKADKVLHLSQSQS